MLRRYTELHVYFGGFLVVTYKGERQRSSTFADTIEEAERLIRDWCNGFA